MEPFLKELEQAVADEYSVKILYHKSGEEQSKYRLVDPYRIIYWNNRWYVIGFCHLRNDIRSFRVDQIESLILTENKCKSYWKIFQHVTFFLKNLLPTIKDKEGIASLVINGNRRALDDICQHWFLGHYLQERTSNQAVFLLEKDMIHTYVPYLILPYGKSIQVIEPISLKKDLLKFCRN